MMGTDAKFARCATGPLSYSEMQNEVSQFNGSNMTVIRPLLRIFLLLCLFVHLSTGVDGFRIHASMSRTDVVRFSNRGRDTRVLRVCIIRSIGFISCIPFLSFTSVYTC